MLSVADALARIVAGLEAVGDETVALADASGRVLAAAVAARLDQPAHDVSAMDGYALTGPLGPGETRHLVGRAPAGHPFLGAIGPGETVRVFTGSVLPAGADRVLLQEDARVEGELVAAAAGPESGRHVRPRGGDFRAGDVLLSPGTRLGARAIGLAASANHPWLTVRRRPLVALLATGDEVVLPGEPIAPGGLASSNSLALAAMVRAAGGEVRLLPIARDDPDEIARIAASAAGCDLLVTIGGASVGDHDLVRPALARFGFDPDVFKVAMRPGKPLMSGHLRFGERRLPVFGLPGNPVSAMVCGCLFLLPAIATLLGLPRTDPPRHAARLGAAVRANDQRADHLRARVERTPDGLVATPFGPQDSARLADFARADALVLRAPHAPAAEAGDPVELLLLAEFGV